MHPDLAQAALALQVVEGPLTNFAYGQLMAMKPQWVQEEGFRYTPCRQLVVERAVHLFGRYAADLLAPIHFELLEIEEGLRPHKHQQSESLLFIPYANSDFEMVVDLRHDCRCAWEPIYSPRLCCVPPSLVHGFRRKVTADRVSKLFVLVASYPHVEEADTFYVDV